jgi:hypothetical protein
MHGNHCYGGNKYNFEIAEIQEVRFSDEDKHEKGKKEQESQLQKLFLNLLCTSVIYL